MINHKNYEEYIIDYLEGTLDSRLVAEMEAFLSQNPSINSDIDNILDLKLQPDLSISYPKKDSLTKQQSILPLRWILLLLILVGGLIGALVLNKQQPVLIPEPQQVDESVVETKKENLNAEVPSEIRSSELETNQEESDLLPNNPSAKLKNFDPPMKEGKVEPELNDQIHFTPENNTRPTIPTQEPKPPHGRRPEAVKSREDIASKIVPEELKEEAATPIEVVETSAMPIDTLTDLPLDIEDTKEVVAAESSTSKIDETEIQNEEKELLIQEEDMAIAMLDQRNDNEVRKERKKKLKLFSGVKEKINKKSISKALIPESFGNSKERR